MVKFEAATSQRIKIVTGKIFLCLPKQVKIDKTLW
jgi:hypothetical protein